ncbi:MAG: DUF4407 domain-containing protein [Bacteroidota bacterium]
MNGNTTGMVSTEQEPSQMDLFLWWLATAEKELIYNCVVDRNRYRIVGLSVLATWLFAVLAWTYFFSTAVDSPLLYVPLGLFMGFIILTIDRTLIKGINKSNKNKLTPLLFRGILAITIGTFMAQPAVLYLFDKEVKLQTSLDNEGRKMQKRQELDKLYSGQKNTIELQKKLLEKTLADKYAEVNTARTNFLAETDGSGGSGKVGISTIALAKKREYEKLENDYSILQKNNQPQLDSLQRQLIGIEDSIKTQEKNFANLLNNGFLTRIQALQNLVKSNDALAFRYYLIVVILMLIELMPVIAKTLLPAGTYDERVRMQEDLEKDLTRRNISRDRELKEYYNDAAMAADKMAIDDFFLASKKRRFEKMDSYAHSWSGDKHQSFDGLWQKMKKEIMTRWEN